MFTKSLLLCITHKKSHCVVRKRILRHLKGTTEHVLHIRASLGIYITGYTNAHRAGYPDDCLSTSAFVFFLGPNLERCPKATLGCSF